MAIDFIPWWMADMRPRHIHGWRGLLLLLLLLADGGAREDDDDDEDGWEGEGGRGATIDMIASLIEGDLLLEDKDGGGAGGGAGGGMDNEMEVEVEVEVERASSSSSSSVMAKRPVWGNRASTTGVSSTTPTPRPASSASCLSMNTRPLKDGLTSAIADRQESTMLM